MSQEQALADYPTPTQFLRQAALRQPVDVPRKGPMIYADVPTIPVADARCYLCGGATQGMGVPRRTAIKPTWTDQPFARVPDSAAVCAGCAFAMSRRELRNYAILATAAGLIHPPRTAWRTWLLQPPPLPWLGVIPTTGQKWLVYKAAVNWGGPPYRVWLEDVPVAFDPATFAPILATVERLLRGFTKAAIATGDYPVARVLRYGLRAWEADEAAWAPWRGTRVGTLALFVAQKPEAEEEEDDHAVRIPDGRHADRLGGVVSLRDLPEPRSGAAQGDARLLGHHRTGGQIRGQTERRPDRRRGTTEAQIRLFDDPAPGDGRA